MRFMKSLIIFSFLSAFIVIANINLIAQDKKITEKEVPSAVLNSFHKAYPKAEIKGLSTEIEKGKKYFEVESMEGTVKRDLLFTPVGKIAEIEESITPSNLPKGSVQTIEKKIAGAKIEQAEKVISGVKVTYELSVTGKNGKFEVVLNKEGKIIKIAKANTEEGDED